ncbi:MAG: hypothetical protein K9M03_04720 [Kiritimatiellales bacterium]|nr:hypothetical protein [Kiritimatiellales bacterium]
MPTNSSSNKTLLIAITVLLTGIVIGGTFAIGINIGRFQSRNESFRQLRNIGFPEDSLIPMQGMGRNPMKGMMRDGRSIAGEVLSIDDDSITILGRNDKERILVLGSGARIGPPGEMQTIEDVIVGSTIIGFGEPDKDGNVQVRHIMIVPAEDNEE